MARMKEVVNTIEHISMLGVQLEAQMTDPEMDLLERITPEQLQKVEAMLMDLVAPAPQVVGYCGNCYTDHVRGAECCQEQSIVEVFTNGHGTG